MTLVACLCESPTRRWAIRAELTRLAAAAVTIRFFQPRSRATIGVGGGRVPCRFRRCPPLNRSCGSAAADRRIRTGPARRTNRDRLQIAAETACFCLECGIRAHIVPISGVLLAVLARRQAVPAAWHFAWPRKPTKTCRLSTRHSSLVSKAATPRTLASPRLSHSSLSSITRYLRATEDGNRAGGEREGLPIGGRAVRFFDRMLNEV